MVRLLFATAFLLGAIAVGWMASVFFYTDALALTIVFVIGGVYGIGVIELFQFRHATSTLSLALATVQNKIAVLDEWIDKLDPSIRNSVQMRIEGERVGLPAPVLTPYFVGLLVMLGLLGTFVGMVDTLRGAVSALEGTTDFLAIRAGLAAPIKGLGLAFGTSVAGVATSAMLGLMSTLSRRDRMLATRRLDTKIATVFQEFSLAHCQRETFKAIQMQAQAFPAVAEKLHTLTDKLSAMGERLIENQDNFHVSVKTSYSDLTVSVDKSLKESLTESVRLAGETIKPLVNDLMAGFAEETKNVHKQISLTHNENFQTLARIFSNTSAEVTNAWKSSLESHNQSNRDLIENTRASLASFKAEFEGMTENLLEAFNKASLAWNERQKDQDQDRLNLWAETLEQSQNRINSQLADTSKTLVAEITQTTDLQRVSFETITKDFSSMASLLASNWQQTSQDTLLQQRENAESLVLMLNELTTNVQKTAINMHNEMAELLKSTEELVNTRIKTEESWINGYGERMEALTATLKTELNALRDDEERRGQAAAERFANLETMLASQLATITQELEEPMATLIETASSAPHAALELIQQLRQEVTKSIDRDNDLLKERQRIMEELDNLARSLTLSSTEQRNAISRLVDSSRSMMEDVSRKFGDHVGSEVSRFSEVAESFAVSAVEIASLGDAFSTAVKLFDDSNKTLMDNLAGIETALDNMTARSDEQMGYYVAQAREIIDHSMLSQKEIIEELQKLHRKDLINFEAE